MQIVLASDAVRVEQTRELFREYWESFGFTPCFQNFDRELEELPGKYAPPRGRLAIAVTDELFAAAGCVAIRPLDERRCELKRLYVRPQYRGTGLGLSLLEWALAQARACDYTEMVADTMPVMERALEMYDRIGFERTQPYSDQATPGAIYLRLKL